MHIFDEPKGSLKTIEFIKHFLPQQGMLKDFVHHNTLHAFDELPFHEGLAWAQALFGYQVYLSASEYQSARYKSNIHPQILAEAEQTLNSANGVNTPLSYARPVGTVRSRFLDYVGVDFNALVHPTLFRLMGNYMDQGISIWKFPRHPDGFLASVSAFPQFLRNKKVRSFLLDKDVDIDFIFSQLLGTDAPLELYLIDQQFAHSGWSGMVSVFEDQAMLRGERPTITLAEIIKLELLLELDLVVSRKGLMRYVKPCLNVFKEAVQKVPVHISPKAALHEALEWTYYNKILCGLLQAEPTKQTKNTDFQAVFCLDDREGSLRRHIESVSNCQTFGTAGFFNLPIYFKPKGSNELIKSCPVPVQPQFVIHEVESSRMSSTEGAFNAHAFGLLGGWFISQTVGFYSGLKLLGSVFFPGDSPAMVSAAAHMPADAKLKILNENSIEKPHEGISPKEGAKALRELLISIGLKADFASLVYFIGHGASSVNNTHYAAYDCGACSGRAGSVNARSAAFLANHHEVRTELHRLGITIPQSTRFVGGLHDTTRDTMHFYDVEDLEEPFKNIHQLNVEHYKRALQNNAVERAKRLPNINIKRSKEDIHRQVVRRSQLLFEPRPEWNHAGNAICLVGPRVHNSNLFLDRRAFLQSYEPGDDPDGALLSSILAAITPVCAGINLEYYFSKTDTERLGAGTKLSHNVMGLIGVANGMDGDLLPGLPAQMVDIHDPFRLLMVISQKPDIILRILNNIPELGRWYFKEWAFLVAKNPNDNRLFRLQKGEFKPYYPVSFDLKTINRLQVDAANSEIDEPIMVLK
jgi:uncharacterized protein YbcC (UPF0753/DUF2309 family)